MKTREPRLLFIDGGAGASGDMILGALVDLGVPLAQIREVLRGLPLEGWTLSSRRVQRAGLAARKVRVGVREADDGRDWRQLERIIRAGKLEPTVRDPALRIFRRLIEAEARVHGIAPDKIHLHEAGDDDAILDIVGACAALAHLSPLRVVVSALTTGFGSVRCRHGLYPVPAPATAQLVRGVPVRAGSIEVERLTPTGAAILTTIADAWGPLPAMRPLKIGYGAGDRDLEGTPNALRMILGEPPTAVGAKRAAEGEVAVIEFAVDDTSPETLAHAAEQWLEAGALDVTTAPVVMKKGRSGHRLTVLCRPERMDELAGSIFRETGTLGLRYRLERRFELERRIERVATPYGAVGVKVGRFGDEESSVHPEHEDCAAQARRHGVALEKVRRAALDAYHARGSRKRRRAPKNRKR